MNLNVKKKSLVQNITYMALMAAINVVFVLLTTFVPAMFLLIVFVLPLTSVLVTLHCQKKYFPIYAIATIGLCLLCTIWKIDDTIFYVVPSIISGFIFGIMVEKESQPIWIILVTTLIQVAFTYASIPLIKVMTGRNIVEDFATVFGLNEFTYLDYLTPCFIYAISLIQEVLAYIIIKEEIVKFGYKIKDENIGNLPMILIEISLLSLSFIFAFVYGPLAYLFSLMAMTIGIVLIIHLFQNKKIISLVLLPISLLITVFLTAAFYQKIQKPLGLLLILVFFALVTIIVLINNYLLKENNKDTI